jgi:homoserine acetyltransferase
MLAMLYTWQSGDVSAQSPYNGDFSAAMQSIRAKALVLPCKTDMYFREFFRPCVCVRFNSR